MKKALNVFINLYKNVKLIHVRIKRFFKMSIGAELASARAPDAAAAAARLGSGARAARLFGACAHKGLIVFLAVQFYSRVPQFFSTKFLIPE